MALRRRSTATVRKEGASWPGSANRTISRPFEVMSKRRKSFPSETRVGRGLRVVHGDKELVEKLGRNDLCPCGSGRRFQALLPAQEALRGRRTKALLLGTDLTRAAGSGLALRQAQGEALRVGLSGRRRQRRTLGVRPSCRACRSTRAGLRAGGIPSYPPRLLLWLRAACPTISGGFTRGWSSGTAPLTVHPYWPRRPG